MGNLITILITVVSGVLVYIIGEILQTVWLTPLQKFKAIKHDIAVTLTFYARLSKKHIYILLIKSGFCCRRQSQDWIKYNTKGRNC